MATSTHGAKRPSEDDSSQTAMGKSSTKRQVTTGEVGAIMLEPEASYRNLRGRPRRAVAKAEAEPASRAAK